MSFIGGPLPNLNSSSSSSSPGGMYGGAEPGINTESRSQRNQQRYARFSEGLRRAAAYKDKKAAENEADKEDDDDKEKTGNYGPKGFKISPDSTVVSGYTDPGFTLQGVQGRSVLGAVGAGLTPFFPVTGQAIGAVGSLTGI